MCETLHTALKERGIEIPPTNPTCSNGFIRWGKEKRYYAKRLESGTGWVFGDWSEGLEEICFDNTTEPMKPEEIKTRQQKVQEAKTFAEKERQIQYQNSADKASVIWQKSSPALTNHPYLAKKQVKNYGLRQYQNRLAIPLYDSNKTIISLQFIGEDGEKRFLSGGKKQGGYFPIGKPKDKIIICEGYATGATIHEATQDAVAVAFDAGNLKPVAEVIKSKYPEIQVLIAADNDAYKGTNIGIEKAQEAALAIGCNYVHPSFRDTTTYPTDFNDLMNLEGAEVVRQCFHENTISPIEWNDPNLFEENEGPELNASLLPPPLNNFAQALSDMTETPQSMTVMTILSTVATALQGKFRVKPKAQDDYSEPLNIYVITALPPANRKSTVLKYCTASLVDWEQTQKNLLKTEIKKQWSLYHSEKELIKNLRKKLKSGDCSLIDEIANRECALKEPDALPRLFVNDVTPESLASIVAEQKGRLSIISDEGGIIEVVAGLYTGGQSNIDLLLKGWDEGMCRIKRKTTDISMNPLLTINLVVQPQVILNMGGKKSFAGKGLLERFLYCFPRSLLGFRKNNNPPIPPSINESYTKRINELLDIPQQNEPRILILSEEALHEWKDFQNQIEIELRPTGRLSLCLGWGGKICGQALRIAALLHVAKYGKNCPYIISKETTSNALSICSLLVFHAITAFSYMTEN